MEEKKDNLVDTLGKLLSLKFSKKGMDLINEVEKFGWEDYFSKIKSQDFVAVLKENHISHKCKNSEGITVLVPLDENGEIDNNVWFDWLKGSACYPFELDPWDRPSEFVRVSALEHVLLQLAHGSHYNHRTAALFFFKVYC